MMSMESEDKRPEAEVFTHVEHFRQRTTWDCGIACCVMICRLYGINGATYQSLCRAAATQSVWTIDLAYLLSQYGIHSTFFTILAGVDPEYKKERFYARQLKDDEERVNVLFAGARERGIQVENRSLSAQEYFDLVLNGNILLTLVDRKILKCKKCDSCVSTALRAVLLQSYVGHFVLVTGVAGTDYVIVDPSSSQDFCLVAHDVLERARKRHGTDEDILAVRSPKYGPPPPQAQLQPPQR